MYTSNLSESFDRIPIRWILSLIFFQPPNSSFHLYSLYLVSLLSLFIFIFSVSFSWKMSVISISGDQDLRAMDCPQAYSSTGVEWLTTRHRILLYRCSRSIGGSFTPQSSFFIRNFITKKFDLYLNDLHGRFIPGRHYLPWSYSLNCRLQQGPFQVNVFLQSYVEARLDVMLGAGIPPLTVRCGGRTAWGTLFEHSLLVTVSFWHELNARARTSAFSRS